MDYFQLKRSSYWMAKILCCLFWFMTLICYPESQLGKSGLSQRKRKNETAISRGAFSSISNRIFSTFVRNAIEIKGLKVMESIIFLSIVFPVPLMEAYRTMEIMIIYFTEIKFRTIITICVNLVYYLAYVLLHIHAILNRGKLLLIQKRITKLSSDLNTSKGLSNDSKAMLICSCVCILCLAYFQLAEISSSFRGEFWPLVNSITDVTSLHFRALMSTYTLILYLSMQVLALSVEKTLNPFYKVLDILRVSQNYPKKSCNHYHNKIRKEITTLLDQFDKRSADAYFRVDQIRSTIGMINDYFESVVLILLVYDVVYISSLIFLTDKDSDEMRYRILLAFTSTNFITIITSQNSFQSKVCISMLT